MGYLYTTLVIAASVAIKTLIESWWRRFKEREALRETPMRLRNGIYVPWGRVQRIERAMNWFYAIGFAWLGFWVLVLLYALIFEPLLLG